MGQTGPRVGGRVLLAGPDGRLRVKVRVAPRHRDKSLVTGHPIPPSVLGFQARGEPAEVLYVISAQRRDDPACWRTERADDDRAGP